MRILLGLVLLFSFGARQPALGISITGADWAVHFNLPDQSAPSFGADEFVLRDLLVSRLNSLQSNQAAHLATYTWSGTNLASGGSGPIMNAMEAALNRGARLHFVADRGVNLQDKPNGSSNSLAAMAARPVHALVLVQDDSASGIMHDKLGLFDLGPTNRLVISGSWNFTAGASTFQWNIMTEIRNEELYAACSNEFAELLAGRFHDHAAKSHAHDRAAFTLAGSWSNSYIRFAPYPDDRAGGTNSLTDITNAIGHAQSQVVFALNQITRLQVATSLVRACDRGVEVLGVIPLSDATSSSVAVHAFLTNAASYATTNRVRLLPAYRSAQGSTLDDGSDGDLVHAKWMVIDPFGARPVLIHGSANWTDAALVSESSNDENLLFLRHGGLARAFYAHFKRITRTLNDRDDFSFTAADLTHLVLRPTDTNLYVLERTTAPGGGWTSASSPLTGLLSGIVVVTNAPGTNAFYRVRRAGS